MKSKLAGSTLVAALATLFLATLAGIFWTTGNTPPLSKAKHTEETTVDLQTLRTAQELARIATAEEQLLAHEALRLADRDTDLAFAAALHDAAAHPPAPSTEMREVLTRLQNAQKLADADQQLIARLTAESAKATGAKKEEIEQDLEMARAELEIDQDDAADAKEDLVGAGGDPQTRIQRMVEEHAAAQKETITPAAEVAASRGWVGRFSQWMGLRRKTARLNDARSFALDKAAQFAARHREAEKQVGVERAKAPELVERDKALERQRRATLLASARRIAAGQKQMATFDKRVQDQTQLADVYRRWNEQVAAITRRDLHGLLIGLATMLLAALAAVGGVLLLRRYCATSSEENRRIRSMEGVVQAGIVAAAVVSILVILFGPPNQLSTVLGLIGAAATVVLKDFVMGFFGWFVLMGKNGIRVGDWVEIQGVGGEVVEIGLFRTVLLETGNWNDSGHPTGRRVTFTNSFAIGGHYFNFSTNGQWLWDELRLTVPAGKQEQVIDAILKHVTTQTADDAKLAEEEWQRVADTQGLSAFSAKPAVNMRPAEAGGVEIAVRYITRANKRHEVRAELYRAVVEMMR